MQYQENYFEEINRKIAPQFEFDEKGNLIGIELPLKISEDEKKILLSYLWKIRVNRDFILRYYSQTEKKLIELREKIKKNLKR